MTEFNYDRFIKLMMMTTSQHDGECLNALRMANAELMKLNRNWEEVIRGMVTVQAAQPGPKQHETRHDRGTQGPDPESQIARMFEAAFAKTTPGSSFYGFLESIHDWWKEKGFLTDAQYDALKRSALRRKYG